MSDNKRDTLWRKFSIWWNSSILGPFLLGWVVGAVINSIMETTWASLLVMIVVLLSILSVISNAVDKEMKLIHKEMRDSGEFDVLKGMFMKEAAKITKENEERNALRDLVAVCHECDNDIYLDDVSHTSSNKHIYCEVCWDLRGTN